MVELESRAHVDGELGGLNQQTQHEPPVTTSLSIAGSRGLITF
jgi:hypothetical protein